MRHWLPFEAINMLSRQSLIKWPQNNKNSIRSTNKNWVHPPEALKQGHVAYLVKFLGYTEVGKAKGIDVVKEGITKLKFSQQIKRSEGVKVPKVELTISIDGVGIQDAKTKKIFHQYPLHRISYCADDKADKKFFSFIAKESGTDKHSCFVFSSDKLAEEITLTIGEAFDLAYQRFLDTSGRDLEMRKRYMLLQKQVQELEAENTELKKKLEDLEKLKNQDVASSTRTNHDVLDLGTKKTAVHSPVTTVIPSRTTITQPPVSPSSKQLPPPVPPRLQQNTTEAPKSGLPSQDLLSLSPLFETKGTPLDDLEFNPRENLSFSQKNGHESNGQPLFSTESQKDLFGADPFNPPDASTKINDPFGMGEFTTMELQGMDLDNAIGAIDQRLSEMKDGFSRGLSFGFDNFDITTLDPPKAN